MYEKVPLVWFPCLREFYVRNFSIKNKLKINSDPKLSIWPVKDGASLYNNNNNYDNGKNNNNKK